MEILRRYIVSLAALIALSGCMKDFEPEADTASVLCLNAMITAGEPFDLSVTHTWRYSKPAGDPTVADAVVELYVNGEFVENLVFDDGAGDGADDARRTFRSAYAPACGDRLKIVARSARYGEATAEVTMPAAPSVESVTPEPTVTSLWFDGQEDGSYAIDLGFRLSITLDIADDALTSDYFAFSWESGYAGGEAEDGLGQHFRIGSLNYDAEPIFSEHISTLESVMGADAWGFSVFSDRSFSGKRYPLKACFDSCSYYLWAAYDFDEALLHPTVTVSVDNISKSYYDWLIYKWQLDNGFVVSLGDIGFADTLLSCSNVSTGAGIVAARASAVYSVDLYDFIKENIDNKLEKQ